MPLNLSPSLVSPFDTIQSNLVTDVISHNTTDSLSTTSPDSQLGNQPTICTSRLEIEESDFSTLSEVPGTPLPQILLEQLQPPSTMVRNCQPIELLHERFLLMIFITLQMILNLCTSMMISIIFVFINK